MMRNTLLLIDAHAIIHRAFHALPDTLKAKDGTSTNAIYGFFLMILKVINDFNPNHIAVCFDTPKPTFRKKLYTQYQAKRPPMDNLLKAQIPIIKDLLDKGGITRVEREGFEADDVIGSIAKNLHNNFDQIYILTGDRDLLQLTDTKTSLIAPKKGVSDFYYFTPESVREKFGIQPSQIPDYKSLAGDSSDNYNTAKGIGPKTAQKLLQTYKTVENLLEKVDTVENPKWKEILITHKDNVLLFKKIATIVCDLDVSPPISSLAYAKFRDDIKPELMRLELNSLVQKIFTSRGNTNKVIQQKTANDNDQISLF